MPFDWRKLERLLSLQIGDTANEQVVFAAYSALNGEFDNMICVLKLVTNLEKGNTFEVKCKGLTEDSREKLAEALATFISVDNTRASVSPWVSSGTIKKCTKWSYKKISAVYKHAVVIEGEEVLTLLPQERGTQKFFVTTYKIPEGKWEDWVALCQSLYQ